MGRVSIVRIRKYGSFYWTYFRMNNESLRILGYIHTYTIQTFLNRYIQCEVLVFDYVVKVLLKWYTYAKLFLSPLNYISLSANVWLFPLASYK